MHAARLTCVQSPSLQPYCMLPSPSSPVFHVSPFPSLHAFLMSPSSSPHAFHISPCMSSPCPSTPLSHVTTHVHPHMPYSFCHAGHPLPHSVCCVAILLGIFAGLLLCQPALDARVSQLCTHTHTHAFCAKGRGRQELCARFSWKKAGLASAVCAHLSC